MAKIKPLYAILGVTVLVAGYILATPPDTAPKRKVNNSFTGGTSRKKADDLYLPEDYTAKFAPVNTPIKNAFKPLIVRNTSTLGSLNGEIKPLLPDGIPSDFAGGESGWVYTGNAVVNGVPNALLENTSSGEAFFITPGETWKSSVLVKSTPTVVVLRGPAGIERSISINDGTKGSDKAKVPAEGLPPATGAPLTGAIGGATPQASPQVTAPDPNAGGGPKSWSRATQPGRSVVSINRLLISSSPHTTMKKAHAPLLCLALAMLAGSASAQFDSGGGSSSNDDKPAWEQFSFNPKTRIKLNFRNANIDMVLALFEKTSGVSIVKDPALTGPISLTSAKPISLKDAFQILGTTLQLKGYELRKDGKILVIAKKQDRPQNNDRGGGGFDFSQIPQQPDSVLKVYPIQYANASQVARVVNDVFGTATPQAQNPFQRGGNNRFQRGGNNRGGQQNFNPFAREDPPIRASSDDFSNTVIVNAPDRQQRYVSDLIKQIDKQTDDPQRTRIYKLVYANAEDVQPVLQNVLTANAPKGRGGATTAVQAQQNLPFFLRGANAGQGQGSVTAEQRTNSVIVTATEDNLKLTDQLVDELDKPVDVASTTFVFPLVNARAEDIASLLGQAFGTRSGTSGNTRGITSPQQQRQRTNNNARNNGNNNGRAQSQTRAGGGDADPQADAKAETTIPITFEDPTSEDGELQTNISIAQGRNFRNAFGQNNNRNNQNQNGNTTARDAQGRIVNVSDLTNQITVIPDNNTNSVIVVGSPDAANLVQSILSQLDKIPEQVMIETIIVEATLDDTTRLGVEFGLNIPKIFGSSSSLNGGTDFGLANANPPLQGGRVTLSGGNLTGFVNAIRTDNRFNILSTPRIFTSNNQEAQINISQSIPYVLSTRQDINGGLQFNYASRTSASSSPLRPGSPRMAT